jgi:hypothetical protein
VIDPTSLMTPATVIGAFDSTTNVGVVPLDNCGPNGIALGTHGNLLEGCDTGNDPSNTGTVVINGVTKNYATVANITGSDEVAFNQGDNRYYLAASDAISPAGSARVRRCARHCQRFERAGANYPTIVRLAFGGGRL